MGWWSDHVDNILDGVVTVATGGINKIVEAGMDMGGGSNGGDSGSVSSAQKTLEDTTSKAQTEMTTLGRDQLNEAKRQYDNNTAIAKPIIDAQVGILNQAKTQGDDYYNYMVSKQRPVEDALNAQALKDTSEAD